MYSNKRWWSLNLNHQSLARYWGLTGTRWEHTNRTYLISIAKNMATTNALRCINCTFSLCNVILKLVYPLPAMIITESECNQIMHFILNQGLSSVGVVQTFPCALAHGPLNYNGLNIPNLFMEQMTAHVETLVKTKTNLMIQLAFCFMQLARQCTLS